MATPRERLQRRPPRLAEAVADVLRQRILAHEFEDGSLLPKQEDLVAEFRVSLPSIREAQRILELEGLITVRRGNVGGAVVHLPQTSRVAYTLGLVLEGRGVAVDDVVLAMASVERLCAMACARRRDRRRVVVPKLRAVLEESEQVKDDPAAFARLARRFHEEVVANCGNETFIVMAGALEMLWTAQVKDIDVEAGQLGEFSKLRTREQSIAEHQALIDCIAAGDAEGAERVARAHAAEPSRHGFLGKGRMVSASPLRDD